MAAMSPLLPTCLLHLLPNTLLHALVYESRTMLQTQLRPGFMLQAVSEGMRGSASGCKPAVIKPAPVLALLSTSANSCQNSSAHSDAPHLGIPPIIALINELII